MKNYMNRNERKRYDLNYGEITQDAQRKQLELQIPEISHSLISSLLDSNRYCGECRASRNHE